MITLAVVIIRFCRRNKEDFENKFNALNLTNDIINEC